MTGAIWSVWSVLNLKKKIELVSSKVKSQTSLAAVRESALLLQRERSGRRCPGQTSHPSTIRHKTIDHKPMPFKVNARTILQLGEELISSDAVAFYELIKNSFDARSRRVDIDVVVRLRQDLYVRHRDLITAELKA